MEFMSVLSGCVRLGLTDSLRVVDRPDRYLAIVVDGGRPEREGVTPMPVPAMLPDEFEKTVWQNAPGHH